MRLNSCTSFRILASMPQYCGVLQHRSRLRQAFVQAVNSKRANMCIQLVCTLHRRGIHLVLKSASPATFASSGTDLVRVSEQLRSKCICLSFLACRVIISLAIGAHSAVAISFNRYSCPVDNVWLYDAQLAPFGAQLARVLCGAKTQVRVLNLLFVTP